MDCGISNRRYPTSIPRKSFELSRARKVLVSFSKRAKWFWQSAWSSLPESVRSLGGRRNLQIFLTVWRRTPQNTESSQNYLERKSSSLEAAKARWNPLHCFTKAALTWRLLLAHSRFGGLEVWFPEQSIPGSALCSHGFSMRRQI